MKTLSAVYSQDLVKVETGEAKDVVESTKVTLTGWIVAGLIATGVGLLIAGASLLIKQFV